VNKIIEVKKQVDQFSDSDFVAKWDEFVRNSSEGSLWHSSSFLKCIASNFGYSLYPLYKEKEGEIVAALPLFSVPGLLGKSSKLISIPVSSWCGVISDSEPLEVEIIEEARNLASQIETDYIEYRQIRALGGNHAQKSTYVTFLYDLTEGSESIWNSMNRKTRGSIRKAEKSNLKVNIAECPLEDFYNLYVLRLRDLGSPAYPYDLFASLKTAFGNDVLVTSVTKEDTLVSACFSIKYKDTLHALLAGVDKRYLSLNPYSLMYWKLIEFACSNSLKWFDFGRSRIGTGSYNFKKNWGFPSTTLHYQYDLMKAREIPNLESGTTITKLFRLIWRMLPLGLVKWLGPKLRKYIVA